MSRLDGKQIKTSGCSAGSQINQDFSCEKAIDGNMNTDWAVEASHDKSAWIQVKNYIRFDFYADCKHKIKPAIPFPTILLSFVE